MSSTADLIIQAVIEEYGSAYSTYRADPTPYGKGFVDGIAQLSKRLEAILAEDEWKAYLPTNLPGEEKKSDV